MAGMNAQFVLRSGDARVMIGAVGAEPLAWSVGGRELLWQPDPTVWARTSPVLFPIVGRAAGGIIRVGGRAYDMPIHGFAPDSAFEPVEHEEDRLRLVLRDDADTRRHYPFAFSLTVDYRLGGNGALSATFEVANRSDVAMPYALGLHPGFRWPFAGGARDGYAIEFEADENPNVPLITPQGLFSSESRSLPLRGRSLALDDELMTREALCFLDARSGALRFVGPDGSAIRIEVENFPHFALWSRPPAPYLCIETWTGHGDPDGFAGELSDKPSMRLLAPGAVARHALKMSFVNG